MIFLLGFWYDFDGLDFSSHGNILCLTESNGHSQEKRESFFNGIKLKKQQVIQRNHESCVFNIYIYFFLYQGLVFTSWNIWKLFALICFNVYYYFFYQTLYYLCSLDSVKLTTRHPWQLQILNKTYILEGLHSVAEFSSIRQYNLFC